MTKEEINFMIDERNKDIVTINDSEIVINGQKNKIIKIIGMNDVINPNDACTLFMKIIDENNKEIQTNSLIKISKIVNGKVESFPSRTFYADVNMYINVYNEKKELINRPKTNLEWFRFKKSITLNENDKLIIKVVHFESKISKTETMFALEACITEINYIGEPINDRKINGTIKSIF